MKHKHLIDKMTIEEKAALLSGKNVWQSWNIDRLDIPSIFCSDGPHGVRKQAGSGDHLGLNASLEATCFPTAATIANSWEEELGEEIGRALGEEAAVQEVDVLLGPGLNIKRSPLCGRNFEYFSEDPYLSGKMASAYVRGIQSQGVYACPKHFAVNSQELRRMAMNSVIDERTLREIYLEGFEIAVKEGKAKTIMSSYNEVNGVYANESTHLLQDILRKEWGFDGIVITDWGASNDHVNGVKAGSNLEMPSPGLDSARELIKAVEAKTLTMEELDQCVDDLLDIILTSKENKKTRAKQFDKKQHHELARKAARKSIVLLKNEEQILPIQKEKKVAVIGDFAKTPRYQGAGSSMVNPTQLESMEQLYKQYFPNSIGCVQGYQRNGEPDAQLSKEALELAKQADIVVYCFGLDELSESEGLDRLHMRIPQNQIELLEELYRVNPNIVGVLSGGSAIEMPWDGCCKGILHGYLGGQASASAMLEVLSGAYNPSGKLNETYPIRYEETPAFKNFPSSQRNAEYRESLYVGYRYYETVGKEVQYPFGYGLSYTTFAYEDLEVKEDSISFTVKNTGKREGEEIAQLYVKAPGEQVFTPKKALKGFTKIALKPQESKRVTIAFDDKTFRYWNVVTNSWEVEGGEYQILVGSSVRDIHLIGTIVKQATTTIFPYEKAKMASYYTGEIFDVSEKEFESLLGHAIPDGSWSGELTKNDAICQMYYAKSWIGRFIYKQLTKMKKKSEEKGKPDLNILFIYNMPFRGIAKMTNGMVSMHMVDGMVEVVNGHFFKGMKKIIGGFFSNRKANKIYKKNLTK